MLSPLRTVPMMYSLAIAAAASQAAAQVTMAAPKSDMPAGFIVSTEIDIVGHEHHISRSLASNTSLASNCTDYICEPWPCGEDICAPFPCGEDICAPWPVGYTPEPLPVPLYCKPSRLLMPANVTMTRDVSVIPDGVFTTRDITSTPSC